MVKEYVVLIYLADLLWPTKKDSLNQMTVADEGINEE